MEGIWGLLAFCRSIIAGYGVHLAHLVCTTAGGLLSRFKALDSTSHPIMRLKQCVVDSRFL